MNQAFKKEDSVWLWKTSFVYIFVYLCRIGMTIYTLLLTSSQAVFNLFFRCWLSCISTFRSGFTWSQIPTLKLCQKSVDIGKLRGWKGQLKCWVKIFYSFGKNIWNNNLASRYLENKNVLRTNLFVSLHFLKSITRITFIWSFMF